MFLNQELATKFEVTFVVVPFQRIDLTRLAIAFYDETDASFRALRRMPHMCRQKVHFPLAHDDFAPIARHGIE